MKHGSKILGLLLIGVMVVLTSASWAEAGNASAPSLPDGHPAGCHVHGGNALSNSQRPQSPRRDSPVPTPVSHNCCLAGHDAAVVLRSDFQQPSDRCTNITQQFESALTLCLGVGFDVSPVLSADPPGATPLRI